MLLLDEGDWVVAHIAIDDGPVQLEPGSRAYGNSQQKNKSGGGNIRYQKQYMLDPLMRHQM